MITIIIVIAHFYATISGKVQNINDTTVLPSLVLRLYCKTGTAIRAYLWLVEASEVAGRT